MLIDLSIHNFAIIDTLNLELHRGLTVISGETGAGKSITVDALSLLLGERTNSNMIYKGRDQGEVSATFDMSALPRVKEWLKEQQLESGEDELILRRVINKSGRSRGFINGRPMPLHMLKRLGEHLVDIHGQHAHQSLMKQSEQRRLVDLFSDSEPQYRKLTLLSANLQELHQQYEALLNRDESAQERINFLKFQLAEFHSIAPEENEWERINERFTSLSNYENRLSILQSSLDRLNSDEGVIRQLTAIQNQISTLAEQEPQFKELAEMLENASILINESDQSLQRHHDLEDFDEQELIEIDERMRALNGLARKHRIEPEALLEKQAALEKELAESDLSEEDLEALKEKIKEAEERWQREADLLTKGRKKGVKALNQKITEAMQNLAMEGGVFKIKLAPLPPFHPQGNERIEFEVSANPGQPLMPLNQVASGGELARISLAIAVILSLKSARPILVFDEVDTGVGGAVAEIIGQHLHQLSEGRQVICVTHLPQVAIFGHHHLLVEKSKGRNETTTSLRELNHEERIGEIARMLGGVTLSDTTYQHAKELLGQIHPDFNIN